MLTTDLFLVTYPPDHVWLPYLFRSLPRATGWRDLIGVTIAQPANNTIPHAPTTNEANILRIAVLLIVVAAGAISPWP